VDGRIENLAPIEGEGSDEAVRFSYEEAFSRNLGWVTAAEQQILRRKRIAIAGLGGVGGSHLLTLTRLGIGAFRIADFDCFELANFNRQAGAMMSTIGRPKATVLAEMARDINPELELEVFPHGIDESNLDAFLAGVDCYVDSLDFFELDLRLKLFARLDALGIPAIIAAPIGMGTGYLVFMPGGMSFERYFRLSGLPPEKQRVNFALGLTPRGFQRRYLVDASRIDLKGKRGPSTGLSCELCAGVAAAEVLKIVLKRGTVRAAPWYHQFDAYRCKWVRGWLPGGNANPLQRLKLAFGYRLSEKFSRDAVPPAPRAASDLDYILGQARWAPSGDNTQPWRFEIQGEDDLTAHVKAKLDLFDYKDGEPTLLAAGILLETMRIAASTRGRGCRWRHLGETGGVHRIAVHLPRDPRIVEDPLAPFIQVRSVDRRSYKRTALTAEQKAALEAALGDDLAVLWHEGAAGRWQATRISARGADIRLRLRQAYDIHCEILDWQHDFAPRGLPVRSLALDPATRRLMRWVMRDWRRMDFMNRIGGTRLALLEMDVLPGLCCAAHFTILRQCRPADGDRIRSLLAAGQALQRFWLVATRLGLVMQPSFAPLWFAHFSRYGIPFTTDRAILAKSARLAALLDAEAQGRGEDIVFRGRLGEPRSRRLRARSVREELSVLLRPR